MSEMAVVVPVFNPEPGLVRLCGELVKRFELTVIVDDGSVEQVEAFQQLPSSVIVLRHERNRGKGCAIKTSLAWLLKNHPEVKVAVFADGDGQHLPDDILAVAMKAMASDAVTFGVRGFAAKGVPFRSWWGNKWTAVEVRLAYGFRLSDTQTGLRAIPSRLFPEFLGMAGDRFEYEARIFRRMKRLHERIDQVSIKTVYIESNRASHFRPFRDTLLTQMALWA